MPLKIGALTKRGLFFPVVSFIYVLDQTLAEQLYRDKVYGSYWVSYYTQTSIAALYFSVSTRNLEYTISQSI